MATPKPAAMWPLTISVGVNDALHVMVGATAYTATIAAATYYTPASLAAAVQAALTAAVANSWSVSVSSSGRVIVGGASAFLLSKTSGTNRLLWSQQFDNAAWTKRGTAAVVANGGATAPDGTSTADRVSGIGAVGVDDIYQAVTGFGASEAVVPSVWIRRVSASGVVRLGAAAGSGDLRVDLATIGTGWVRVEPGAAGITVVGAFQATAGGGSGIIFSAISGGPLSFDLWQAQIEPGAVPGTVALTASAQATPADDLLFALLGFSENVAPATSSTSPNQHANAWYAEDPVMDDTGDLPLHERSQGVALAGPVKSLHHATRYTRAVQLGFLEAWKWRTADEGSTHLNEAIERLIESGWARFRWFPDQADLATGTDYVLALDTAKTLPRERLAAGAPLYSLPLRFLRYV